MFKVMGWWNGGWNEEVLGEFAKVEEAVAFVEAQEGLMFLEGFGEEGYDVVDKEGNLVRRFA